MSADVPLRLRKEREAAWESYGSAVRAGEADEQRALAFARALELEREFGAALAAAKKQDTEK